MDPTLDACPTGGLPAHARVLDGPGVWLEGDAVDQLARVARTPGCVAAVGLPDLHPGPGTPIGATFAFEGRIWPALVGGDMGCGVRLVALDRVKASGDALERRVRAELASDPLDGVDAGRLLACVWRDGPRGLLDVPGIPDDLAELAEGEAPGDGPVGDEPDPGYGHQLGSVGGGNHFLELARVHRVVDRSAAAQIGLERGGYAVIAHSGSRGLGKRLASDWDNVVLAERDAEPWLRQLRGAIHFARANRLILCWRMLRAVGAARPGRIAGSLDLTHNTVEAHAGRWLHRKGSAPAEEGRLTVVLGSRGAESWLMRGCGSEACLCSVAHGAGRRYDRGRALALMKHRYRRAELARTDAGGRVICDDREALYAEHPDCYKAILPVIDALEAHGAATRVASTIPLVTVKQ